MIKKSILIFSSILIVTFSILAFFYFSNDHKECSNEVKITKNVDGNQIKEKIHICKEKYNF